MSASVVRRGVGDHAGSFIAALYTKGFALDLLLEAGVFLVYVKLIMMAYQIGIANAAMQQKPDEIHASIQRPEGGGPR